MNRTLLSFAKRLVGHSLVTLTLTLTLAAAQSPQLRIYQTIQDCLKIRISQSDSYDEFSSGHLWHQKIRYDQIDWWIAVNDPLIGFHWILKKYGLTKSSHT